MTKSGKSILRGARQALDYARGGRKGFVAHVPRELPTDILPRPVLTEQASERAARHPAKPRKQTKATRRLLKLTDKAP